MSRLELVLTMRVMMTMRMSVLSLNRKCQELLIFQDLRDIITVAKAITAIPLEDEPP